MPPRELNLNRFGYTPQHIGVELVVVVDVVVVTVVPIELPLAAWHPATWLKPDLMADPSYSVMKFGSSWSASFLRGHSKFFV